MAALAFEVEHGAFAKLAVAHALPEAYASGVDRFFVDAARAGAMCRVDRPGDVDARPDLLEQRGRDFLDEARRSAVAVHAMQPALLGIRQVQLLHGSRRAYITKPAFLLEPLD